MRSGSVSDQPMIELLCSLVAQKSTGNLEAGDGRRRWNLWFEQGRVVFAKSNLKSEASATLEEKNPGLPKDQLAAMQAEMRVHNLLRLSEGNWTFTPDELPPTRAPFSIFPGVWSALRLGVVPEALIAARLDGQEQSFPRLSATGVPLGDLALPPELTGYISDLDGQRPLQDVLEFAPTATEDTRRALALALMCGTVQLSRQGSAQTEARATSEDPIGSLFSEVFTTAPTVQVKKADPEVERLHEESSRIATAKTHFDVLGVAWDLPPSDFRKAYMRLAQQLHPDRWSNRPSDVADEAASAFARLAEAWEVLGDETARQAYIDRVIHGKKSEDELAMEKLQDIMDAENIFKAGMTEFNAGRIVQAHEHFKSAAERLPEEHEFSAFYGYTTFKLNQGKDDLAANSGKQLVRDAVEKATKLHNGWALMGMIYLAEGEPEIAKKALLTALKLNPTNPLAQRELKRFVRMEEQKKEQQQQQQSSIGGFFSKLFGKK